MDIFEGVELFCLPSIPCQLNPKVGFFMSKVSHVINQQISSIIRSQEKKLIHKNQSYFCILVTHNWKMNLT